MRRKRGGQATAWTVPRQTRGGNHGWSGVRCEECPRRRPRRTGPAGRQRSRWHPPARATRRHLRKRTSRRHWTRATAARRAPPQQAQGEGVASQTGNGDEVSEREQLRDSPAKSALPRGGSSVAATLLPNCGQRGSAQRMRHSVQTASWERQRKRPTGRAPRHPLSPRLPPRPGSRSVLTKPANVRTSSWARAVWLWLRGAQRPKQDSCLQGQESLGARLPHGPGLDVLAGQVASLRVKAVSHLVGRVGAGREGLHDSGRASRRTASAAPGNGRQCNGGRAGGPTASASSPRRADPARAQPPPASGAGLRAPGAAWHAPAAVRPVLQDCDCGGQLPRPRSRLAAALEGPGGRECLGPSSQLECPMLRGRAPGRTRHFCPALAKHEDR